MASATWKHFAPMRCTTPCQTVIAPCQTVIATSREAKKRMERLCLLAFTEEGPKDTGLACVWQKQGNGLMWGFEAHKLTLACLAAPSAAACSSATASREPTAAGSASGCPFWPSLMPASHNFLCLHHFHRLGAGLVDAKPIHADNNLQN